MVVEGEAQLQQQPALDDAARELRVARVAADGAEQDGVVLGELLERARALRKSDAGRSAR